MRTPDASRALPLLALLVLAATPALARPLDQFPSNVVQRPLLLGQEIFERAVTSSVVTFVDRAAEGDRALHLGTIASTLWLAVGATDWLQLGLTGTVTLHRPDERVVRPGLEIAALPWSWLAPRVRVFVPDCWDRAAWNVAVGVRGRYVFVPAVLDGVLDAEVEQYRSTLELAGGSSPIVTRRSVQVLAQLRHAFATSFYAAMSAGLSKAWLSDARGTDPADPGLTARYGLEAGFTSSKHVDIVLGWGTPPVTIATWDWAQVVWLTIGGRI